MMVSKTSRSDPEDEVTEVKEDNTVETVVVVSTVAEVVVRDEDEVAVEDLEVAVVHVGEGKNHNFSNLALHRGW
jgi:alpha-acetolactate decarboxylase